MNNYCKASTPFLTTLAAAVASALLLVLAGCASPAGIAPQAQMRTPDQVGLATPPANAGAVAEPLVAATWWQGFQDPALNDLVDRALRDSPTLALAQARVQAAAASADVADSASQPKVTGSADVTRQRFTANGLYPPPLGGSVVNSGNVQATLSWELDFFGRHRAELAAALGAQRAAEADAAAACSLLASRVAQGYFQLARLIEQREVARATLTQREELLGLTRQRVGAGLDTTVELRQGEGSLPETRLQIETLDEQLALARHALAALTGQAPSALDSLAPRLQPMQAVALPQSLPAELLAQRPDVAAARWRVEAAAQNVALARTDFYPNVNLVAFAGLQAFGLDNLFNAGSRNLAAGPAISLPIFDAGRLRATLRGKAADADAAVESYNATVFDAVRDAADQVSSLQAVARQQREQAEAQAAAESAYDLAVQRYRAGLGTYLVVLSAESNVLTQRRTAADLKARALDGQVALARALGGGYRPTVAVGDAGEPLAGARTAAAHTPSDSLGAIAR